MDLDVTFSNVDADAVSGQVVSEQTTSGALDLPPMSTSCELIHNSCTTYPFPPPTNPFPTSSP